MPARVMSAALARTMEQGGPRLQNLRAPWGKAAWGYCNCAATEQDILRAQSHAPNAHHESPPARPRVIQNLTRTRRQCHLHDNAIACHPSQARPWTLGQQACSPTDMTPPRQSMLRHGHTGFEPRAVRMRSGCDATTPCALECILKFCAYPNYTS